MTKFILLGVFLELSIFCQLYETLILDPINYDFNANTTLRRLRRQSSPCKNDPSKFGFQCETNPDCIENDLECDGKEDCPDGSDEKQSLCQNFPCPGYLFKCEYGACISLDHKCDGKKDCKDNSDETNCPSLLPRINTNCGSDQFECNNGQCIIIDGRCNGIAECQDASDETEKLCLNIECPGYTYKCRYGACVDGDAKCNNVKDCFDNSDEDEKTCGIQTPRPPVDKVTTKPGEVGKKCTTPNQPENGNWEFFPDNSILAVANKAVPVNTQIIFRCNTDFQLSTSHERDEEILYCSQEGQWSFTVFPTCQAICHKLYNQKHAILQCKLDGSIIPCNKATHGTQLTYTCDPYYEPVLTSINVCVNGEWQQPEPKCIEVCGEKQVSAQTLVVNGKVVKRGNYPWVVALYSNRGNDNPSIFTNICGGSLITTSVVLTAAHCVTAQSTGEQYGIKFFRVAAGKYYNKFMDTRDNDTAQYLTVTNIVKHPDYRGQIQNFQHDIALMKLKTPFTLSKVVQPVCFSQFPVLRSSGTATVTGWGYTTTSGNPSDALNEIDLEYVDNEKCETELDPDFARQYLISDKFCAGLINKNMGVCKGDSGGGLVVQGSNDRFILKGVVSLAKPFLADSQVNCDVQRRALFTRVDYYLDWIQLKMLLL